MMTTSQFIDVWALFDIELVSNDILTSAFDIELPFLKNKDLQNEDVMLQILFKFLTLIHCCFTNGH